MRFVVNRRRDALAIEELLEIGAPSRRRDQTRGKRVAKRVFRRNRAVQSSEKWGRVGIHRVAVRSEAEGDVISQPEDSVAGADHCLVAKTIGKAQPRRKEIAELGIVAARAV